MSKTTHKGRCPNNPVGLPDPKWSKRVISKDQGLDALTLQNEADQAGYELWRRFIWYLASIARGSGLQ